MVGVRDAKSPKGIYFCIFDNQFCQHMNVPNMRRSQSVCYVQMPVKDSSRHLHVIPAYHHSSGSFDGSRTSGTSLASCE